MIQKISVLVDESTRLRDKLSEKKEEGDLLTVGNMFLVSMGTGSIDLRQQPSSM